MPDFSHMSFAGTGAGAGLSRPLACGRMVEMSAESVPSIPNLGLVAHVAHRRATRLS